MMDLLTYQEASDQYKCSKKTLERAWQRGKLKAVKPGRYVLFEREELEQWVRSTALKPTKTRGNSLRKPCVVSSLAGGTR